jgi:hypothetical protein
LEEIGDRICRERERGREGDGVYVVVEEVIIIG